MVNNFYNEEVKVGDKVRLVVEGSIEEISDYELLVDGCEITVHVTKSIEILERPSTWTDGDVVEPSMKEFLWVRKYGRWYDTYAGRQNTTDGKADSVIDRWVTNGAATIIRKQKS